MSDTPPESPETEKPKAPTSPEEITRKLEDFIKNTLGGQVLFTRIDGPGGKPVEDGDEKSGEETKPDDGKAFEFHYKPADIKAYLDRFVIRGNGGGNGVRLQLADRMVVSMISRHRLLPRGVSVHQELPSSLACGQDS